MQYTREMLEKWAPEMLSALQRLIHPAADDTDDAYAQTIVACATGNSEPCECHGMEALCENCNGHGYVPLIATDG